MGILRGVAGRIIKKLVLYVELFYQLVCKMPKFWQSLFLLRQQKLKWVSMMKISHTRK